MSSSRSRVRMLMLVVMVLSLTNVVVPALMLQPQKGSSLPTNSAQNPSQPTAAQSTQTTKGHAVLVGTVNTLELPATSDQPTSKGLPFFSPKGSGSSSEPKFGPQVLATTSSSSIGVSSAFDGINFTQSNCGCTPPDVQVAAGPNYVVEMVNTEGETFTKTGVSVNTFFLGSFFHIPSNHFASDPKIIYDSISGRWFATMIDYNFTATGSGVQFSRVMIAVTTTSDPTTWLIYSVTGTFGLGPVPVNGITDQPILGVSDDKLVISVNDFALDDSFSQNFQGDQFWVLNKPELVAGASSVDFASFGPNPSLISVQPVQSLSTTTTEYMVTAGLNTTYSGCVDCNPQLLAVTGLPPGNVTVTSTALSLLPIRVVPTAVEPGAGINTDDTRVLSAAWYQGKLWFTLHDGCIPTGDTVMRSCVRLVQIDTTRSPAAVLQNFDFGANGQYYYYPALRIDGNGNLVVVYGFSSSTTYPSIAVTGQLTTDPINSLAASKLLKAGSVADLTGRYGDYFGAGVDPTDTNLVWVAGEYNSVAQGAPNCPFSCWSTFIGSTSMVGFSAFPNPSPLLVQLSSSATSTITLASLNGFSGKVTLTTSTSSSGLTASINPTKVTLSAGGTGTATLTVTTSSTTPPGVYVVAVTGVSGSFTRSAIVGVLVPDFGLSASPSTISEAVGGSTSSTVTVATSNGFVGAVSLTTSISPSSGASCSMSPSTITLGTSGTSTLTCSSTSTGLYNVTVTGTSGSIVHRILVTLSVAPFSTSANPSSFVLNPTVSGTSTITVGSVGGFAGTVTLTATTSSTDLSTSFSLSSLLIRSGGSNSSTLTITPSYLAVGSYTVTVTAKSGSLFNTVTITIVVKGFSLNVTPGNQTAAPGATGTFTVTIASLGGFTGTVNLSYSSQAGLTCSFNPSSVTLGSSVNSTLSCSATSGNFGIQVSGLSGSVSHYVTVYFSVVDYSLSITTTNVWVPVGTSGVTYASLSSINGFAGSVTLSASGVPTGTTVTFNPNPIQISYYGSYVSITISPTSTTPPGNQSITITATSGSISHSALVNIIVLASSSFNIAQTTTTFTGETVTYSGSLTFNSGSVTLSGSISYSATNSTTGAFIDAATVSMSLPIVISGIAYTTSAIEIPTSPLWTSVTCIFYVVQGTSSCSITRTLDLDHNGSIDNSDYSVIAGALGCSQGQQCYVQAADLRATGTVDSTDVSIESAHVGGPLFVPADFGLSATPTSISFRSGQAGTSQVTATGLNGFTGSISLSISTPAGIVCTLNPTSISPGTGSSTLTCNSSTSNTYTVTLTGTAGPYTHSSTVTVTVLPYSLSPSPSSLNLPVQSSGTVTITVTAGTGFSGVVNLTATVSPSGPTVSLNPTSVTLSTGGSATSTLSVSAGSAATGSYTITIIGTSGTSTVSTTVSLNVSDFALYGVGGLSVPAGGTFSHIITVNSINGFTGTISLSVTISPNTLTCTLSPTSVTLGSSANSNLNCPNVSGGAFTLTLTGTSGTLSHTISGNDYVIDFTMTPSTTSLTVERLSLATSTLTITTNAYFGCFCTMILTQNSPSGFSTIFSDPAFAGNMFGNGLTKQMYSSYTDTLTIAVLADSSVTPGTYTLTVTVSGGAIHTLSFTVTVPNFSISLNPSSITFKQTSSGSTTVTVTGINGYAGTIQLSATFPSALSCSFSNSISLGSSGTSTLTCTGSVGTYTVIVAAAGNSLSHSVNLTVTVTH